MNHDPVRRFLGVDHSADPLTLLGLPAPPEDRLQVENALHERLNQVFRHPAGRSRDAEVVRAKLRAAAQALLETRPGGRRRAGARRAAPPTSTAPPVAAAPSAPATPSPEPFPEPPPASPSSGPAGAASRPPLTLTDFDRSVLAVLVGCGGWNAQSRARLVAVSGSYQVSAAGLIKVVRGLSDYARRGGPPLAVSQITGDARVPPARPRAPGAVPISMEEAIDRWTPELTEGSLGATIKLSLLFGAWTLAIFVVFLRVLLGREPAEVAVQPVPPTVDPIPAVVAPALPPIEPDPRPGPVAMASFRPLPTFLGNALPPVATDAADLCPEVPAEIELVAAKLSITDTPSDAVYRSWQTAIDTVATGWVLADDTTRRAVDQAIRTALLETADTPTQGDQLLAAITPPRGRLAEPVDLWRGAWLAGTLADIGNSASTPPALAQRAREQLAITLGPGAADALDFDRGARLWLDLALGGLVDMLEVDHRAYDFWETWLSAHRRLGDRDRLDAALMDATARLLRTTTDLARPGPTVNVLGRLLTIADFEASPVVRHRMRGLFDDADAIRDHDLWVLTSLLAQLDTAPWFGPDLVLPDEAGKAFRNRIRDRVAAQWPPVREPIRAADASRGLQVDSRAAGRWHGLLGRALVRPYAGRDRALLEQQVLGSRLNEAAGLIARRQRAQSEAVMDDVDLMLKRAESDAPGIAPAPLRRGQPVGADGEWAQAYADAGRQTDEKLTWLRSWRSRAGTDLGPLDAEVFVREVYRGKPYEVRTLARSIVVEQFSTGPNVAMEMLDQFPEAPRTPEVSETIRRLTGHLLPLPRSADWERATRLALVEHALALQRTAPNEIDALAALVRDSVTLRFESMRHDPTARAAARTPQEAARLLADAWQGQANAVIATTTVPDDLAGLARRRATRARLVEGPIQAMAAEMLAALDGMTYVTVAEQPGLAAAAQTILDESARRRREAAHVLEQLIEIDRAIARMWALRMGLSPDGAAARGPGRLEGRLGGVWPARPPASTLLIALAATLGVQDDASASLEARLEALRPESPLTYFELAEEIADAADTDEERRLARRLFALAGVLDRARLGRSACLALADLEEDERLQRRLRSLATLLGDGGIAPAAPGEGAGLGREHPPGAVLAVTEAFSNYRRGRGQQALTVQRDEAAAALLEECDDILPGGLHRFLEDCRLYRGELRPHLSRGALVRMLKLEQALLAGRDRPWSAEVLVGVGRPLVEVDPARLAAELGVNPDRTIYRNGRWVTDERP